ncbi:dihydrodipicolinate synthase/N-acetylneuraminate lyase [Thermocatellispora tengchongensis]|uniref:Dihydrodipicolinate synthase/N-acetylneuraminate lyase n=1 Tax=Thermocatellispora tengchongensis TaxID=1073253 RepID=A0A840P7Q9_9ACTN|nr:dihydrodipicolinate synthase family protein [Thermocatellispora tengchongensis]MBB5133470.1 dihydrodipicolinate synthase/N-acetylneuraminate lyase [Thermocatellispora tengchongensis]
MPAGLLREGLVIPAHPLALTERRTLDERRQRALTRYYLAAGAGGVAVAVHTTQFEIREAGLLRPVLEITADVVAREAERPVVLVAGACGDTAQAVAEAELAASLGYHAVLLSPRVAGMDEAGLLARAKAVGDVLPVIGFYLQEAVGGRRLSPAFWRSLAAQESLVAIKMAPFDRYRTLDVVRGVAESGRGEEIALYTGNDDNILADLLTPVGGRYIAGGLLGQWAVWTRAAVLMFEEVRRARAGDDGVLRSLLARAAGLTDANGAVFDVAGGFRGCIAGVHEVLRGQGLLAGTWCLDPAEGLSPGQAEEIERVRAAYPWLVDDAFVAEHLDDWLR